MHSLEYIIALNNRPRKATVTRHCSFLFSPRRDSVICHSAIHRSTFRLSSNATQTVFKKDGTIYQTPFKNCRAAFTAFLYWSKQGQAAVDSFIEAIEVNSSLQTAERLACQACNPDWKFTLPKACGTQGNRCIKATRKDKLDTIVSAPNWRDLNERLR